MPGSAKVGSFPASAKPGKNPQSIIAEASRAVTTSATLTFHAAIVIETANDNSASKTASHLRLLAPTWQRNRTLWCSSTDALPSKLP